MVHGCGSGGAYRRRGVGAGMQHFQQRPPPRRECSRGRHGESRRCSRGSWSGWRRLTISSSRVTKAKSTPAPVLADALTKGMRYSSASRCARSYRLIPSAHPAAAISDLFPTRTLQMSLRPYLPTSRSQPTAATRREVPHVRPHILV